MTAKHVLITGRVQGVSFRAWTRERAQELGISGWVRNLPDGSVEALVSGSDEAIETLIAAFHEGPPTAEVKDVRATEAETHAEPGFRIHGSAIEASDQVGSYQHDRPIAHLRAKQCE